MKEKELEELKSAVTDKEERFFKGVLYGEFGVRKTTTALRTSRKRAILLHADKGWQVIHNHPEEFGDNVVPVKYEGISQVKAILQAVAENIEPFHDVDLIVPDTFSQMQENYIDFLLENATYGGKFRDKIIPNAGVKIEGNVEIPAMPDYHLARNKLRPVINALVKAPVNVMFLAHVREPGPMDKTIERRPNVTEALYKVLAREATFIGYMKKDGKTKEYMIDFEPKPTQSAKSQIASLTDKKITTDELPKYLHNWLDKK